MTQEMPPDIEVGAARPAPGQRRTVSIGTVFAVVVSLLVAAPLAIVVVFNLDASSRNTFALLNERTLLLIDAVENGVRRHLEDAAGAVDFMIDQQQKGSIDLTNREAANAQLKGAISALPNVQALILFGPDEYIAGAFRDPSGEFGEIPQGPIESKDVQREIAKVIENRDIEWGELVFRDGIVYANYAASLAGSGLDDRVLVAAVSVTTLSQIVSDISRTYQTTAFVLDGENRILAHPALVGGHPLVTEASPTIPLTEFGDPVLAAFPDRELFDAFGAANAEGVEVAAIDSDNSEYILINGEIEGFSPRPWTIGVYFPDQEVSQEVQRLYVTTAASIGALLVAVALALLLSRQMSRPIREFTRQTSLITDLNLENVAPLSRSRIREIDRGAAAFNAMLDGLRAFAAYVPRSLVNRLVRSGIKVSTQSVERELTIMFTDIVGFTALSEHMSAVESAELLNRHFQILSRLVETHGGTVDKFMGDGMLAFWGAPEPLEHHAERACLAALDIAKELHEDNATRIEAAESPIRIRMGIHTGPVVVGNVGGEGRINYTIVGDAVNIGQRLQDAGRYVAPEDESIVIISAETAAQAGESFTKEELGAQALRGREGQTAAFRLTGREGTVTVANN